MKKILSILVLLIAFCAVSFAQSAPKTAKKATLLTNNTQIKDLKTGEVLRVAKGAILSSKTISKKKMIMTRSGANTPNNSKKSNNLPAKQLPKQH